MARLMLLIAFLAYPFGSVTDSGATAYAAVQHLAPLVRERFKLYVPVSHCGFADNQHAFNLTLDKFHGADRAALRKAAYDGWAAGDDVADAGPCAAAIDRLRAADDKLLAQAELVR